MFLPPSGVSSPPFGSPFGPPFSPLFFSGGVAIVVRSPSANVLFCWPRLERAFEIFMHANSSEKHEKRKQQNEMKSKTTGKKS